MDRENAEQLVRSRVVKIGQYEAVSHINATMLLGDDRFGDMMDDRIRCLGPARGFVYPWNVIDYLQGVGK